MIYQITFARSARKELQALPHPVAVRVLAKIESLTSHPRPEGCRRLLGPGRLWRIRVGEYRIIYGIDDDRRMVDISVIRHRSHAYR